MSVPAPSLDKAALPEMFPTVSEPASTVTVELALSAADPELILRALDPKKVRLPLQIAGKAGKVTPLATSSVAPGEMVRLPVPNAAALPRTSVP